MLDPASVDLAELTGALDDRTPGRWWWIERSSGRIRRVTRGVDNETPAELTNAGWVQIQRTGSHESYRDMSEFVASVHRRRAADLLDRAINGPGAFRRFKDTLGEFPDLRDTWYRFRDARGRRRALDWLVRAALLSAEDAERAATDFPDPTGDDEDIPAAVAVDLSMLYGDRLDQVLVVGPWAKGEIPDLPDLELVVVLTTMQAAWDELHRMDEVLWRHTARTGVTITAVPVVAEDLGAPASGRLVRAVAEAVRVV